MAIVISGVNNNDKITAADGNIDLLSAVNYASPITVTDLTASNKISGKFIDVNTTIQLGVSGVATATTFVGNLTGNVNQTSNLLLQIAGSEKFRIASSGQLGIGGANYGNAGQVLTSGGSGSAATWSTINSDAINEGNTKAEVIDSGSDGRFIVETEGSERLRIQSDGDVGIGTESVLADTKVHILDTTAGNYRSVAIDSYATNGSTLIYRQNGSQVISIGSGGSNNLSGSDVTHGLIRSEVATVFAVGNSEKVRITGAGTTAGGLFLVGTNDTGYSGYYTTMTVGDASGTNSGITIAASPTGYSRVHFADANSGAARYAGFIAYYHADDALLFSTNNSGSEKLRISSTGSVGINQTDPSRARLHVVGNNTSGDIVAKFKSGGSGADSETYIALVTGYPDNVNDYEGHAHIGVQRNGASNGTSLVFKPHSGSGTSVTERMRITPTGSVTKPQQPYVHILGITNTGGVGDANNGTATTYGAITYSAGRVTAQVEGNYMISFNTISDNGTGRIDAFIKVNGTSILNMLTSSNGAGYRQKNGSIIYHLNVNDYVDFSNQDWYNAGTVNTAWKTASVYLLG